jgi:hypothetical protein
MDRRPLPWENSQVQLDSDAMTPVLERASELTRAELDRLGQIRSERISASAVGESELRKAEREARRVAGEVRTMVAATAADIALDSIDGVKAPRGRAGFFVHMLGRSVSKPPGAVAIENAILAAGLGAEFDADVIETILGPWDAVVGAASSNADEPPS